MRRRNHPGHSHRRSGLPYEKDHDVHRNGGHPADRYLGSRKSRRVTARDPVGDRAHPAGVAQPATRAHDALLHQLVHPFNHGGDPSRTEHGKREPVTHVEPRLAGRADAALAPPVSNPPELKRGPVRGVDARRPRSTLTRPQERSCPWFRGPWSQPACVIFAMMHHLDCVPRTAGARQRR